MIFPYVFFFQTILTIYWGLFLLLISQMTGKLFCSSSNSRSAVSCSVHWNGAKPYTRNLAPNPAPTTLHCVALGLSVSAFQQAQNFITVRWQVATILLSLSTGVHTQ